MGVDGRRARRDANRRRIVEALLTLVDAGVAEPGAQTIAHKAGVSVRTVFRCFPDMGTLYSELAAAVRDRFERRMKPAPETADRTERFEHLLKTRLSAFGDLETMRFTLERYRHLHPGVAEESARLIGNERGQVQAAAGADRALEPDVHAALCAALSFETWRQLRQDQGVSKARAGRAIALSARAILSSAG